VSESFWTWVLFLFEIVGISGMWMVGRKVWWGWAIVLGHSIPWAIYSVSYERWGFVAMVGLWWSVNSVNMVRWKREAIRERLERI